VIDWLAVFSATFSIVMFFAVLGGVWLIRSLQPKSGNAGSEG